MEFSSPLLIMMRYLIAAITISVAGLAHAQGYQHEGVRDALPVYQQALKKRLTFPMAWSQDVHDLPAWRAAGRAKLWELTLQPRDNSPFVPQVIAEQDRGSYIARQVVFNLTAESRVRALLLVPKAAGKHPAALMLHDHGAKFDIGKEKLVATWNDPEREASSRAWAEKSFSGRLPGDALAQRGYVVLAADALGWGDRGPMTPDAQQALAANMFNLGSSMAGAMAAEDVRAAAFLASLPEVDTRRVAAIGFSMGAFRAWQVAALSDDIKVVVAVNWMATTEGLMVPGNNQLRGSSAWQMLHPGLLRYMDFPDVASLAAPKPALFLTGAQDKLFPLESARQAFVKMRRVWQAWDAEAKFDARVLPGGHVFPREAQDAAFDWLARQPY